MADIIMNTSNITNYKPKDFDELLGVSGIDACGYVSKEVIKSLVKSGTRKKFNVVRYVEKLTCPYPPNSQQCNAPPYAYWRTEIEAT